MAAYRSISVLSGKGGKMRGTMLIWMSLATLSSFSMEAFCAVVCFNSSM